MLFHCLGINWFVVCCLTMALRGGGTQVIRPGLSPSFVKDTLGLYISITCGKISGQLYHDRMSKKSPGKCIWLVV